MLELERRQDGVLCKARGQMTRVPYTELRPVAASALGWSLFAPLLRAKFVNDFHHVD